VASTDYDEIYQQELKYLGIFILLHPTDICGFDFLPDCAKTIYL